jgi:NADPH-dependent glutamate synthase beta subunit-like oxidoreductase
MSEPTFVTDGRPEGPMLAISSTSTAGNRTGSWKYIQPAYHDLVAPCIVACPVGIDVEGYMAMFADGHIDEACEVLLTENPMPAITGRVCDHPCESACNRAAYDGAVAVHAVERMLGDRILAAPLPDRAPILHAESIAVIGSGPAGLACAYHLVRLGYQVEIFEQAEEPGGLLRLGIPAYRLPREVLDRQIEHLEALGTMINTGIRVGRDIDWREISERFAAVFVATGAHVGRELGVPGDDATGVVQGLELLVRVNAGEPVSVGSTVVVIGGGNTAIDCARTALRLGARATVVYRRTRDEMPAIAQEVDEAIAEGVEIVFLAAPESFEVVDGAVRAVLVRRMRLGEPDASGRRRPVPTDEPPVRLEADTVVTAIGEDVEHDGLPAMIVDDASIPVDEWGRTTLKVVFAGGDVAGDGRTVATALGAGKRGAIGIDRYLGELRGDARPSPSSDSLRPAGRATVSMARWSGRDPIMRTAPVERVAGPDAINIDHFVPVDRRHDHHLPPGLAALGFSESNVGLMPDEALAEASRCFNCGVCNGCELCMIYCADIAIHRSGDGSRFTISLEHCKGCGVCAEECPRGAIGMSREES